MRCGPLNPISWEEKNFRNEADETTSDECSLKSKWKVVAA